MGHDPKRFAGKRSRIFGGKRYKQSHYYGTKRRANEVAKEQRKKGKSARVVKNTGTTGGYYLYTRKR